MSELSFTNFLKTLYYHRARFIYIFFTLLVITQTYTHIIADDSIIEYKMKIKAMNAFTTQQYLNDSQILEEMMVMSAINENPDPEIRYSTNSNYYIIKESTDSRGKLQSSLKAEYAMFLKNRKDIYSSIIDKSSEISLGNLVKKSKEAIGNETPLILDGRADLDLLGSNELRFLYSNSPDLRVYFSEPEYLHPKTLKFILISFLLSILIYLLSVIYTEIRNVLKEDL